MATECDSRHRWDLLLEPHHQEQRVRQLTQRRATRTARREVPARARHPLTLVRPIVHGPRPGLKSASTNRWEKTAWPFATATQTATSRQTRMSRSTVTLEMVLGRVRRARLSAGCSAGRRSVPGGVDDQVERFGGRGVTLEQAGVVDHDCVRAHDLLDRSAGGAVAADECSEVFETDQVTVWPA